MPVFAYRGLTPTGRLAHGLLDADSARAAWQALRVRGIYPTTIAHEAAARGLRVSKAELAEATRRLASLLAAGLPLTEALAAAAEPSTPATARAFTLVGGRVREGSTFAEALAHEPRSFPPLYRALARASEMSGTLSGGLTRLADLLDAAVTRRRRLVTALTYPLVVVATSLLVLGFLVGWVLPQIRTLVTDAGGRLPWMTRAVLAAADLGAATWPYVLGATLLVAGTSWRAVRRHALDGWATRVTSLPLLGPLVRDSAAARAAHVLGTLLGAGLAIDAAIPLATDAAGATLAPALGLVHGYVRDGGTLSHALTRTAAFPPLVVRLVATGERSGTLATSLTQAAALLETDVARRLDRLTAWLEPALVLVTGGLVLAIVGAILLPILGLDPTGTR
jgi:general secretion pathway protein F